MPLRLIGIRHHSPACAQLVAHAIAQDRPAAVLIEGPSDFNPRLHELLLPHRLPVALYSYAHHAGGAAQCWFPLVDHSPEWVALQRGHASGAQVRFIDLPHWQTRALPEHERHHALTAEGRLAPSRYRRAHTALAERLHIDGDHALWDHLFEAAQDADFAALETRLALYFAELRGNPARHGSAQDDAREAHMARWIAWAMQRFAGQPVLVVCGGWHKAALEALWPPLQQPHEPDSADPPSDGTAGAYVVPYENRQLEALSGYAAGLQSPLYYQWLADHGAPEAAARACRAVVQRLRQRQVPVSTADVLAFHATLTALARLRGHAAPLRHDVLDAAQSAFVKEALSQPAPWGRRALLGAQDHPVLREALLALTGNASGALADGTPLPPLVADVQARLAACGLPCPPVNETRLLDRRRPEDTPAAHTLWQLQLIGAEGIQLKDLKAPSASRHLREQLWFEEHWKLTQHPRWLPSLIEASAHGASLGTAARACLLARLSPAPTYLPDGTLQAPPPPSADELSRALTDAIRAGFFDLGDELARALAARIPAVHDHGELAHAAQTLLDVALAGFWGQDTRPVLHQALAAIATRLLWLLEGLDLTPPNTPGTPPSAAQAPATLQADVAAVRVLDGLLRLALPGDALLDEAFTLGSLLRWARQPAKPPALRGAATGLAHAQAHRYAAGEGLQAGELIALARAVPPRTELGDWLYGLFALTRSVMHDNPAPVSRHPSNAGVRTALAARGGVAALANADSIGGDQRLATDADDGTATRHSRGDATLTQAMHAALQNMDDEDFLVALPALRSAFSWFPPRERGRIAAQVAALLGLTSPEQAALRQRLTQLPQGEALYLQARQIEAQALAWASECGLLDWLSDDAADASNSPLGQSST
ncbi:MAG: DUF5682 family protein [Pseudomonadota bacterium]|nr:DUF5682 family protein [Pseudomonadota bacterium]